MDNFSNSCYAVIKNWLTDDEISEFLYDYKASAKSANNKWQLVRASENLLEKHKPKIMDVCKQTGLDVDFLTSIAIYTDTSWTNWPWHQDHESFYFYQQHKNYLNFYVVLEKEDASLSGLSVVPMNALQEVIPEFMHKIVNCGARRFFPEEDSTLVYCDETGEEFTLPVNIDTIAEHPELNAGDLLLIRGDVIHKTQDNLKSRTAVSIRCTQGSTVISKEKLLAGCDVKQKLLEISGDRYFDILEKLKNRDTITANKLK
jgi:ectoine hydroxylase-related dioxygenase (phytanoyl-CoA dioxygenase family)